MFQFLINFPLGRNIKRLQSNLTNTYTSINYVGWTFSHDLLFHNTKFIIFFTKLRHKWKDINLLLLPFYHICKSNCRLFLLVLKSCKSNCKLFLSVQSMFLYSYKPIGNHRKEINKKKYVQESKVQKKNKSWLTVFVFSWIPWHTYIDYALSVRIRSKYWSTWVRVDWIFLRYE